MYDVAAVARSFRKGPPSEEVRDELRKAISAHRNAETDEARTELALVIRGLQAEYHKAVADEKARYEEIRAVSEEVTRLTDEVPQEPRAVEAAHIAPAATGLRRAVDWLGGKTPVPRAVVLAFYLTALANVLRFMGVGS